MPKATKKTAEWSEQVEGVENKPPYAILILDESGSMLSGRKATISGVNEYIDTVKNETPDGTFTLVTFNGRGTKRIRDGVKCADLEPMKTGEYNPAASTPLYDAVVSTLTDVKNTVTEDQPALVVIVTDGEENMSREYSQTQMRAICEELQERGNWTFVYLGANQDAWRHASYAGGQSVSAGNVATSDFRSNPQFVIPAAYASVSSGYDQWNRQTRYGSTRGTSSFFQNTVGSSQNADGSYTLASDQTQEAATVQPIELTVEPKTKRKKASKAPETVQ